MPIIDKDIQSLVLPLDNSELQLLESQIIKDGIREPLTIWQESDILLDGHNRFDICERNGVEYQIKYLNFDNKESAMTWVINNQLGRRNITTEQQSYYRGWRYNQEKKSVPNSNGNNQYSKVDGNCYHQPKTSEILAKEYNVSEKTIRNDASFNQAIDNLSVLTSQDFRNSALSKNSKYTKKDITQLANSQNAIELIELIESSQAKNLKEAKKILKESRRTSDTTTLPESITLFNDDFMNIHLEPNSIDTIITDPPYPEEYLYLYENLAHYADKILKPGGSLLIMIGQSYLPQILSLVSKSNLTYQWCLSYLTPGGQSPQLWTRKVNCFWKPVLWFVKGEYKGDWQGDVIKSKPNDNDKRFHEWGQSESGMLELVTAFSLPDETILDPFMGGGTTGVVCQATGRKFIGIEIDKEKYQVAERRLHDQTAI